MARGRTRTMLVHQVDQQRLRRGPDELIVEEPLSIRLDGELVATTMRTPGHDFELACGFLHTEGMLEGAPVTAVRYCATGSAADTEFNVVTVDTGGVAAVPIARLGTTSSSCGLCGSVQLDELRSRLDPLAPTEPIPLQVLLAVCAAVPDQQPLFRATGAVHAAAAFDREGQVLAVREDIGRHNAVDKVVGSMLLGGSLPARGLGLYVSGRASFEIVTKAWAAGFAAVVSVSAPSALAVDTARSAGIVLAGFVRGDRCNLYAPERP